MAERATGAEGESAMPERPELTPDEVRRYQRHLVFPGIGEEGQRRLKGASVLVVGAGGLGSPVLIYLAGAGIGRIGVVDPDDVAISNLQRQIVHGTSTIGRPKVESTRERLRDLNPTVEVTVYHETFTPESGRRIVRGYDMVVDGTDNFAARYAINDVCLEAGTPYVYGAIFRFEGQVSVFCVDDGPCYRCVFPETPPPESVMTGEEAGILGVVPGTIGTLQATEVVKWIVGLGVGLVGRMLVYDAAGARFETIAVERNPLCPSCGVDRRVPHG